MFPSTDAVVFSNVQFIRPFVIAIFIQYPQLLVQGIYT